MTHPSWQPWQPSQGHGTPQPPRGYGIPEPWQGGSGPQSWAGQCGSSMLASYADRERAVERDLQVRLLARGQERRTLLGRVTRSDQ